MVAIWCLRIQSESEQPVQRSLLAACHAQVPMRYREGGAEARRKDCQGASQCAQGRRRRGYLKLIDTAKDTRNYPSLATDRRLPRQLRRRPSKPSRTTMFTPKPLQPNAPSLSRTLPTKKSGVAVDETIFGAQRQDDPARTVARLTTTRGSPHH